MRVGFCCLFVCLRFLSLFLSSLFLSNLFSALLLLVVVRIPPPPPPAHSNFIPNSVLFVVQWLYSYSRLNKEGTYELGGFFISASAVSHCGNQRLILDHSRQVGISNRFLNAQSTISVIIIRVKHNSSNHKSKTFHVHSS